MTKTMRLTNVADKYMNWFNEFFSKNVHYYALLINGACWAYVFWPYDWVGLLGLYSIALTGGSLILIGMILCIFATPQRPVEGPKAEAKKFIRYIFDSGFFKTMLYGFAIWILTAFVAAICNVVWGMEFNPDGPRVFALFWALFFTPCSLGIIKSMITKKE